MNLDLIFNLDLISNRTDLISNRTDLIPLFRNESCENPVSLIDCFQSLREIRLQVMRKENLINLIKQKRIQRRLGVRIYVFDIEINCLDDIDLLFGNQLVIYQLYTHQLLRNYSRLANLTTSIQLFNYSLYIDEFHSVSIGFWSRFVNLRKVVISPRFNSSVEQFINFLKKCKLLNSLVIVGIVLDHSTFYANLYVYCPYLIDLAIETDQQSIRDLSFVFKLNYLMYLSINRELTYSQYDELVRTMKLKCFKFLLNRKSIEIDFVDKVLKVGACTYMPPFERNSKEVDEFEHTVMQLFKQHRSS